MIPRDRQLATAFEAGAHGWLVPLGTSALVGGSLTATGEPGSLPTVALTLFLVLLVEEDLRRRRIPNWLSFSGLAAAISYHASTAGLEGCLLALAGAALALGVLLLPFLMRGMGAGDVKALMAVGAFFGPAALPGLLAWITVSAGVLALATLVARGGAGDLGRRWWLSLKLTVLSGVPHYAGPAPGTTAASGLPYGVAIGFGVAAYLAWGVSWIA